MKVQCAVEALCFADESGQIYVNPTSRLALEARCSVEDNSNCKEEMRYQWSINDKNMHPMDDADMDR